MKKAVKIIKQKYAYGTGASERGIVHNYIETPAGELAQHNINVAKAVENAASNPWVQGMQFLGQAAMQYGMNNFKGFGGSGGGSGEVPVEMAYGGKTNTPVEVEGGETAKLPDGMNLEFKGASHENGGIDVALPGGTDIYSKRIKYKGESMASRQKARETQLNKMKKKLEDNPTDIILKNSIEKVEMDNKLQDLKDRKIQDVINSLAAVDKQFALGTGILGLDNEPNDDNDPQAGTTQLGYDAQRTDGEEAMPEKFRNKFVHYAPTTMTNDESNYHRTFNDLLRNLFTTKQQRANRGGLVTVEFAGGGTIPPEGEPDPNAPIETYEGAENYQEYQNYLKSRQTYDIYNNESNRIAADLGESTGTLTAKQFKSAPGMGAFDLPEGATGVKVFEGGSDYAVSPSLEGNYYVDAKTKKLYVPTYEDPGQKNYQLVDSPEVKEQKARQTAWEEETKDLQGYVRNTYYEPECNCNRTELVPLKKGYDVPTNGTFVPKGEAPPEDWQPKKAYGGKVKMAGGGGVPDPQSLMQILGMLSGGDPSQLGSDLQSMMQLNYADAPINGYDVNPYLLEDNSVPINTSGSPDKINADGTYGSTGLKLMDDTLEEPFVLDPSGFKSPAGGGDGTAPVSEGGGFMSKVSDGLNNSQITGGNVLGLAGNLISSFGPMLNTLKNRAGDTVNPNYYAGYGERGLDTINEAKNFLDDIKNDALKALEVRASAGRNKNRTSARSVNTMNALNQATDLNASLAESQIYGDFAAKMASILGTEAGLQNQQDQVVMGGAAQADIANRQDRDNYYTNLGQDISSMGYGVQETGKDLNTMKQQQVMMNLLNQLSKYGITVDNTGTLGS